MPRSARSCSVAVAGAVKIHPTILFAFLAFSWWASPTSPAAAPGEPAAKDEPTSVMQQAVGALKAADFAGVVQPPQGFVALFDGKDLGDWQGVLAKPNDNPIKRAALSAEERSRLQAQVDEQMRTHWMAKDGILVFDGKGQSIATAREYGDFEMLVDWRISPSGDSGVYLRGSPQVQIWDPFHPAKGSEMGSGGLYNNKINPKTPLAVADRPIGEWNSFRIRMVGERVTVHLNGVLVVDNVPLENYWDRTRPIFASGTIELQNHGSPLYFRNIFIHELSQTSQWRPLFNGRDLEGWTGDTAHYTVSDGVLASDETARNIFTTEEFGDFRLHFEFKLTPGANSGVGIRAPLEGDTAYTGLEIQILDDGAKQYQALKPYQVHGSVYGIVPAKRGFLKPAGEWNTEEIVAQGRRMQVILNGETIIDADVDKAADPAPMDGRPHPGMKNPKGHIGILGHKSVVYFRNVKIAELK